MDIAADQMSGSGRGQVLMPWPNRVRDGRYTFDGTEHQLPLDEVENGNAIHGLVRWVAWTVRERTPERVVMEHQLRPQPGYPFALDLSIEYSLSDDGLAVATEATNVGASACPFGSGATSLAHRRDADDRSGDPAHPGGCRDVVGRAIGPGPLRSRRRHGPGLPGRPADRHYEDRQLLDGDRIGTRMASRTSALRVPPRRHRCLVRSELPIRDGVHGRCPAGRRPAQHRDRADDLSTKRVPDRRSARSARTG